MIIIVYTKVPCSFLYYYTIIPSYQITECSVYHIDVNSIPSFREYYTTNMLLNDIYTMFIQLGIDTNTDYNLTYIDYYKFCKKMIDIDSEIDCDDIDCNINCNNS